MRYLVLLLLLTQMGGCLPGRKVSKASGTLHAFDKTRIERKSPGDIIVLPAPLSPKDRPRDTTITYKGEKGARAVVSYDADGYTTQSIFDCPEVDEIEQRNKELDYAYKEKQTERAFNEFLLKEIKSLVLYISLIAAGTVLARSIILRK